MREEGAGAYAADNDDDADGFVSGALRSWLVAPPLAASDISDDRLLRLQGAFRRTPRYFREMLIK